MSVLEIILYILIGIAFLIVMWAMFFKKPKNKKKENPNEKDDD